MFDRTAEIGIPVPSTEGVKKVIVHFPTDEQFTVWRRSKKVQQKDLGRDKFQIEGSRPGPEDAKLLKAIAIGDYTAPAERADAEAEAYYILNRLSQCEVSEQPEREGSTYAIKMRVLGKLKTVHTLRIPSVREMMDYERMRSAVTFGKYGTQDIKINFQAAADLYDQVKVSSAGYKGEIPVPHKAEAINVLLQCVREEHESISGDEENEEQD